MFTASLTAAQISTAAVTVLPVGLHLWAGEAGRKQATWDKRRTGLTVTRLDGGRPTRWQIAVRTVVKLLPWQLAHMSVLLVVEQTVRRDLAEPTPWVVAGLVTAQVLAGVWMVWTLLAPSAVDLTTWPRRRQSCGDSSPITTLTGGGGAQPYRCLNAPRR